MKYDCKMLEQACGKLVEIILVCRNNLACGKSVANCFVACFCVQNINFTIFINNIYIFQALPFASYTAITIF